MSKLPVNTVPEFSRLLEVARVSKLGSHEKISADASECRALAKRLMVPAIHDCSAHLQAKPWRGGGLKVWGEITLDLSQQSVISLEEFRVTERFPVERYFLSGHVPDAHEEELEIDPIEQGIVDLGELVAETIALELEPYPRKPGEVFVEENPPADPVDDKKPNPFNVLKMPDRRK